jgi:hypothetical protein
MYIFEFKHTLTQQDLTDIWQNLPPTIGRSFEEAEVSISHDLLAHDLLGGGELIIQGKIKKGPPIPEKIQWMVFKAKQRAEANYYKKIIGESQTILGSQAAFEAATMFRQDGVDVDVSYNWPYDFFSLIELAQIETEVTLADSSAEPEVETKPVTRPDIETIRPGPLDLTREEYESMPSNIDAEDALEKAREMQEREATEPEAISALRSGTYASYQRVLTDFGNLQMDVQTMTQGASPGMGPVDIQSQAMGILQGGLLPDRPSNEQFTQMVQQIQQAASSGLISIQTTQQLTQLMSNMMLSIRNF